MTKRIEQLSPVRRAFVFAPLAFGLASAFAQSDGWPKGKVIRILNGFTPGSATDIIARSVAPELSRELGAQGVIVENRPGAGGSIAAGQLVQSPPDGYTLFITSSAHAINPAFFPHLSYDTLRDITGVGPVGSSMFVMATTPEKGYQSVSEVVARAKAHPGSLNYGSGGIGSGAHLNGAKFASATNIDVIHVPFRGTTEAVTDLLAGRLDWVFLPAPTAIPLIKSGKIRALAVGPAVRSTLLPSVPSMAEAGYPQAAYTSWVGMFASAKTPPKIVERLSEALAKSVSVPAVKEMLSGLGTEPMPMSTIEFNKFVKQEVDAMANLVQVANIKPNE